MALSLKLFVRKRLTYQDLNNMIQIPIQNYINQKCVIVDDVSVSPVGNKIAKRDANGRMKAAAPVAVDDVARLGEINGLETMINNISVESLGAAPEEHQHVVSDITNFPTSLPANGGNSYTWNGLEVELASEGSYYARGESGTYTVTLAPVPADTHYCYLVSVTHEESGYVYPYSPSYSTYKSVKYYLELGRRETEDKLIIHYEGVPDDDNPVDYSGRIYWKVLRIRFN